MYYGDQMKEDKMDVACYYTRETRNGWKFWQKNLQEINLLRA